MCVALTSRDQGKKQTKIIIITRIEEAGGVTGCSLPSALVEWCVRASGAVVDKAWSVLKAYRRF